MSKFNIQKAVRSNPYYSKKTGWIKQYNQILKAFGLYNFTPTEERFAEAVYNWQKQNKPLKPDGMLGSKSWAKLKMKIPSINESNTNLPVWLMNPCKPPPTPTNKHENSTNIWFGIGGSYGGHFFLIGKTSGHAVFFSATDYKKSFVLTTEKWRLGPGLGGSWGVALMVITSMNHPSQLSSHTSSGVDFVFGVGTRWGEVVKKLKYSKTIKRIIESVAKAKGVAKNPLTRSLLKLDFNDWASIAKRITELVAATGMKTDDYKPNIIAIGIPLPYSALEVSVAWGFEQYRVESISSAVK